MSPHRPERLGLLRWYPPSWRARYGDELDALMEDSLGDRAPTPRFRLSVARAGLRERGHEAGLIGGTSPPAHRARAGSLLVLCAWTAFVLAGSSFAKLSEGFRQSVPAGTRGPSTDAYRTVVVVAVIGGLLVLSGVVIVLPAFRRFLQGGGWASVRGHVVRAAVATATAVAAVAGTVALAHTLTPVQRNGQLASHPVVWYYLLAFIPMVLLVAVMLSLWTVAAVAVARRVDLSGPVLSAEAVLAVGVTAAMVVMLAATAVWWGLIGSSSPWFLQGVTPGSAASAWNPQMVGTMSVMLLASIVAACGAGRVARSWRELRLT